MLGSSLGICLNLLSIPSEFEPQAMQEIFPSLTAAMDILSNNLHGDADRLYIMANMVVVVLSLMKRSDGNNYAAAGNSIVSFFLQVGTRVEESITDLWLLGLYGKMR
jgi:hypothetical protein